MCVSVYIHIYKPDSGNHSCAQFIWAIRLQIQPRLDLQKKTPPPILIVGDRTSGVQSKLWLHSAESDRWQPNLTTSGWIWLPGAGMVTIIKKKKTFLLATISGTDGEKRADPSWILGSWPKSQRSKSLQFVFCFLLLAAKTATGGRIQPHLARSGPSRQITCPHSPQSFCFKIWFGSSF